MHSKKSCVCSSCLPFQNRNIPDEKVEATASVGDAGGYISEHRRIWESTPVNNRLRGRDGENRLIRGQNKPAVLTDQRVAFAHSSAKRPREVSGNVVSLYKLASRAQQDYSVPSHPLVKWGEHSWPQGLQKQPCRLFIVQGCPPTKEAWGQKFTSPSACHTVGPLGCACPERWVYLSKDDYRC